MKHYFAIDHVNLTDASFFLIAGPCVLEDEDTTRHIASELCRITAKLEIPFIFKASFDKANRTSLQSYRGPGLEAGLRMLERIKHDFHVPVLSDIHEPWQAKPAAEVLSVLQIPAFLSRQTDLLVAAAATGLPVNLKKAQFMSAADMRHGVQKIVTSGNTRLLLTERGTFFGYNNLVVDFRNIPAMAQIGYPVVIDATHSVQKPSAAGGVSGGSPEYIPLIARAGIVAGAAGVFLETHPEPARALSDGSNALALNLLEGLLISLKKVYNSVL
jgi:2-dehydro-3-deoxyphosphooctonate aldolase (KDO 8-P synthase)